VSNPHFATGARNTLRRRARWFVLACAAVFTVVIAALTVRAEGGAEFKRSISGPITVDGENDVTIDGMHISSEDGDCLLIRNAQRVTVTNSEIGPCKGRGIVVFNSNDVHILDSYVHPEYRVPACCDKGISIFAYQSTNLLIQGNVIAYGQTNVELQGVSDVKVIGNFLLNPLGPYPRGSQVQVWSHHRQRSHDITIESNYTLASTDERYSHVDDQYDSINIGFTDRATVRNNYIAGGRSHSGCGVVVDNGAERTHVIDNTLVDTGQCGIGVGSGSDHVVEGNRIMNKGLDRPNVGNTALYVWKQYGGACGPVRIANNIAVLKRPNGTLSSYWDGGGCAPVTLTGNVFDKAAMDDLSSRDDMRRPPPIPPLQHTRRAATPYSD
jgi:hypothetical protein